MSVPFLLTAAQMRRLRPHFPLSHGMPRVDDRRVLSGIIFVIKGGLRWRDAPPGYGPHKTLYNRFVRWSRMGVFDRIFAALAGEAGEPDRLIVDSPPQGAPHRGRPAQKGALARGIGRTMGGLNPKRHAVCDGQGRPVVLMLSEGQMNDHKGATMLAPFPPPARELIADHGYDSNPFRTALAGRGIVAGIPPKKNRKQPYTTTRRSTASATASRSCSAASRTGAAPQPATTDAPPPPSAPSSSPQSPSSA